MALGRALRNVKSVLFVCTGNICRSPIAEGLFRRLLGNRRDIEVASAGVHAVCGQPPSLYAVQVCEAEAVDIRDLRSQPLDRKSTRLNSSHGYISYAVFCLKKKKHAI